MRRLAAPLIGGLAISFIMELMVYPIIFYLYQRMRLGGQLAKETKGENVKGLPVHVEVERG
jgi:Cu(I)/Ag(I) efflux system membrane protein CusA/SilA